MNQRYEDAKASLLKIILNKSYKEGEFTLASGAKSSYYIDLKPALFDPDGAYFFSICFAERMKEVAFDALGGLTLGADPLVMSAQAGLYALGRKVPVTMIRKEPKKHGTNRFLEGIENFKKGDRFIVLEDVVTSGGSAMKAIDALIESELKPMSVFAVVDRESGGREAFLKRGLELISLFQISELREAYSKLKS